jgi:hypothetical protein
VKNNKTTRVDSLINLVFLNAAYDMGTTPSTVSVSREYFITHTYVQRFRGGRCSHENANKFNWSGSQSIIQLYDRTGTTGKYIAKALFFNACAY